MKLLEYEIADVESLSDAELRAFIAQHGEGEKYDDSSDHSALLCRARRVALLDQTEAELRRIVSLGGGSGAAELANDDEWDLETLRSQAVDALLRARTAQTLPTSLNALPATAEHYDEVFSGPTLGFSVALMRDSKGGVSVRVTKVDDDNLRVAAGDLLVGVNGSPFDPEAATDEAGFRTYVVQRVRDAPRPVTLNFGRGRRDDDVDVRPTTTAPTQPKRKKKKTLGLRRFQRGKSDGEGASFATLRVCVLKGEDLVAKDRSMLTRKRTASDPYAVVYVGGKKVGQTKTCHKTLSPEWHEYFEAAVDTRSQTLPVSVKLFDYDLGNTDDPMGEVVVDAVAALTMQPGNDSVRSIASSQRSGSGMSLQTSSVQHSIASSPAETWYDVQPTKGCRNATGRLSLALFLRRSPAPMPSGRELDARWAVKVHAARHLAAEGSPPPDPFCVVETDAEGGVGGFGVFSVVGRTPVVAKTADPEYGPYVCEFDAPFDGVTRAGTRDSDTEGSLSVSVTTPSTPRTSFRERIFLRRRRRRRSRKERRRRHAPRAPSAAAAKRRLRLHQLRHRKRLPRRRRRRRVVPLLLRRRHVDAQQRRRGKAAGLRALDEHLLADVAEGPRLDARGDRRGAGHGVAHAVRVLRRRGRFRQEEPFLRGR
mmetsp:Transcript_16791/g.50913  ORF Transcript_16791/g.50913 Transcript_16791/m.50913 type:complete len:651 (+) Transcript_16791:89-2041(+)